MQANLHNFLKMETGNEALIYGFYILFRLLNKNISMKYRTTCKLKKFINQSVSLLHWSPNFSKTDS